MKNKVIVAMLLLCTLHLQAQRVAVLEFSAGAGISQSDVESISSIFSTYFSPRGYTLVERSQINNAIREQNFQRGNYTGEQIAQLGRVLGVSHIVVGDVTYAVKEYNVDVRMVNAETGEIIAKDGITWREGSSYRETLRVLAERLAAMVPEPVVAVEPVVEVKPAKPQKENARFYPTEPSLRFTTGVPLYFALSYDYQLTPSLMVGAGAGIYDVECHETTYYSSGRSPYDYYYISGRLGVPVFAEAELRTPRYGWSLFLNAQIGYIIHTKHNHTDIDRWGNEKTSIYNHLFAQLTAGVSYQHLNFGIGWAPTSPQEIIIALQVSYNLPVRIIRKAFFD